MARSVIYGLAACACIAWTGCSTLKLPLPLSATALDTPTYAHAPSRINSIPITLQPPLRLLWQHDITAGIGSGSLLFVDNTLFVGNLRGELYALDPLTGKRYGWATLGNSIEGTPVIDRELAIVPLAGSQESLVAYDVVGAKVVWRASLGDLHASPLLLQGRVFVGNVHGRFFAVDRSTGDVLWHFDLPDNATRKGIRSSAAGSPPHVVFGADDGTLYNLDAITGRLVWKFTADGAIQAAPSIADSTVYVGTLRGMMYALRLSSGTLLWSDSADGAIYAPPLIHSGLCIFGTTGGMVTATDRHTGAQAWTCNVHSPVNAGLLGVNNLLYAGTLDKELIAIDPGQGSVVARDTVSARIKTAPIAGAGCIFIATDDRLIQAYGEDRK